MHALRDFWQRGWVGKVVLIGAGLCGAMMLCCVALVAIGTMLPNKPQSAAIVPTPTADRGASIVQGAAVHLGAATETPQPSATPAPTNTAIPSPTSAPATATLEPTVAPTDVPTPEPSAPPVPTAKPKPTEKPAPAIVPMAEPTSAPIPPAVDAGAAPYQPGQIKGNRNSDIYHAPGQRDYAKTQANVECFDTEAEAQAAGYRRAKR